jgi:hypothetical protein
MKKCPFCAEEIQDDAVKCKHCFEFLDESKRPQLYAAQPGGPASSVEWYYRPSFIVLTFVTVPPLALPLIWLHPRLHVAWKIVLTVVTLAICWGIYQTFVSFVTHLDEATKMFNQLGM